MALTWSLSLWVRSCMMADCSCSLMYMEDHTAEQAVRDWRLVTSSSPSTGITSSGWPSNKTEISYFHVIAEKQKQMMRSKVLCLKKKNQFTLFQPFTTLKIITYKNNIENNSNQKVFINPPPPHTHTHLKMIGVEESNIWTFLWVKINVGWNIWLLECTFLSDNDPLIFSLNILIKYFSKSEV